MTFNIREFIANLDQGSVAKPSNFSVLISPPSGLDLNDARELMFRIESVELTGRTANYSENIIYGLPSKIVSGSQMQETTMSVILSEDYNEKEFFENWFDLMVGPYSKGEQSPGMFDVAYYNDYIGTVEIYAYSETGDVMYKEKLANAFPYSIGNVQLSWDAGNQIAKLPVTFAYKYYTRTQM